MVWGLITKQKPDFLHFTSVILFTKRVSAEANLRLLVLDIGRGQIQGPGPSKDSAYLV